LLLMVNGPILVRFLDAPDGQWPHSRPLSGKK
jgi:hypothetical protein